MNTSVRAVFFDIDRTLYAHHNDYIPKSSLNAIAQLKARGIIPAIATGRGACALPPEVAAMVAQGDIELIVSTNGQYNTYRGEVLSAHPIPCEDIGKMVQAFKARDWEFTFISAQHMAAGRSRGSAHSIIRNYPCYIVCPDYYLQHEIYQMVVLVPAAEAAVLAQVMQSFGAYKTIRSHPRAVDLLRQEGSKARGIAEVCAALGFSPAETIAFGDGLNDIEMLQEVGIGIAMGDACPELKAVADKVTGTLEEDGIYHALKDLGLVI